MHLKKTSRHFDAQCKWTQWRDVGVLFCECANRNFIIFRHIGDHLIVNKTFIHWTIGLCTADEIDSTSSKTVVRRSSTDNRFQSQEFSLDFQPILAACINHGDHTNFWARALLLLPCQEVCHHYYLPDLDCLGVCHLCFHCRIDWLTHNSRRQPPTCQQAYVNCIWPRTQVEQNLRQYGSAELHGLLNGDTPSFQLYRSHYRLDYSLADLERKWVSSRAGFNILWLHRSAAGRCLCRNQRLFLSGGLILDQHYCANHFGALHHPLGLHLYYTSLGGKKKNPWNARKRPLVRRRNPIMMQNNITTPT